MKFTGLIFTVVLSSAASPSANDSIVLAGSAGTITDASGVVWGIKASAPCVASWAPKGAASVASRNGASDLTTCQVAELAYVGGVVWQKNTAGNWYPWNGKAWGPATTVSPILPSAAWLTWTAPTTDTNGATITVPLTYNVYRGLSATNLSVIKSGLAALTYSDPATSAAPTTYFYAVTAVQAGEESALSQVVSATIQAPLVVPSPPPAVAVTVK